MHVVLSVDVVMPWDVFDVELRFRDSANEALPMLFIGMFSLEGTFLREWINDDTEEYIHQDDVDPHEEE